MTDSPEELKARARRAFEQAGGPSAGASHNPVNPDELARLERALRSLPRFTQEIFLAHRIDGCSYEQIADASGRSQREVRRRMADALYYLARAMEGDERSAWRRWWRARLPWWLQ